MLARAGGRSRLVVQGPEIDAFGRRSAEVAAATGPPLCQGALHDQRCVVSRVRGLFCCEKSASTTVSVMERGVGFLVSRKLASVWNGFQMPVS